MAWDGCALGGIAALTTAAALLSAGACWIASLGPAPRGDGLAFSTLVVDRDGMLLRPYTTPEGRWRLPAAREHVDPRFLELLLAYEDKRFNTPSWRRSARARARASRNWRLMAASSRAPPRSPCRWRGCSSRARERSFTAKLRQMVRAIELEHALSKDEILALYLSLAPYGGNLEGVRAASLAYFGKEPRRLTLGEAALLVALPQAPEQRRPDRSVDAARQARDRVLDRLGAAGVVPPDEIERAKHEPVPDGRQPMPMLAPHAADAVVASAPERSLHRLTIDATLQRNLEELARERARALGPDISVAMLAVDHATGEVLARVGSADYFDPLRAGQVDMTAAVRSPGSTLKPFIFGLGFEDGLDPSRYLDRGPARALRRLRAGEFRSHLPGHGDGAARAAAFVERAGGGGARQGRGQPLHRAARAGRRIAGCCRRARCRGLPWAWAASA